MVVSATDNEIMTRVGPGTPAGELLRRYWHPVAAAVDLTDEEPIKRIRILCEDLVLYRDKSGNYGLVAAQCPHRRASLEFGRVDHEGIRCPYHGWKFAGDGRCLETPAEPAGSRLKEKVRQPAYPVRKLGGLLFAYMGPLPAPALPHWDVLAWSHGKRWLHRYSVLDCNWLQAVENGVDSSHVYFLHGTSTDLGYLDHYQERHEFVPFEYGIMKRRILPSKLPGGGEQVDQHPLLFPNALRHVLGTKNGIRHDLQYRVPIDDHHTLHLRAYFMSSDSERTAPDFDAPLRTYESRSEDGRYRLDQVFAQDAMAWETQGSILDRSQECLGATDIGVVKLRRMLMEQIKIVQAGGTPMGVVSAEKESPLIELDVIRERHGLTEPERQKAS
jgi:5,5'-dehydrodivanillate O-demethylase oxygenase subunit